MDKELITFKKYLMKNGKSPLTIDSYLYDIKDFILFCNEHKNKNYEELVYLYKNNLLHRHLKIATINRKIISIKQYLKCIDSPIEINLEKLHNQNFLDDILIKQEINRMIKICEMYQDYRAKTLILSLYYTGMRISECLQLKISDIDKDYIEILGKGSKYRTVFIPKKLKDIWREYLSYRINKSDKLFTGREGAIGRKTAHNIVKKYGSLAHIEPSKCHCHVLRHVYCKSLVDINTPLDTVASLAGHVSVSTTQIYTKRTKRELLEVINEL